jgi:hypothetical protein
MKMNAMKMKKIVAIFGVIGAVVLVAVGVSAQPPDRVSAPPTDRTDGAYATSARVTIPAGTVLPIVLGHEPSRRSGPRTRAARRRGPRTHGDPGGQHARRPRDEC